MQTLSYVIALTLLQAALCGAFGLAVVGYAALVASAALAAAGVFAFEHSPVYAAAALVPAPLVLAVQWHWGAEVLGASLLVTAAALPVAGALAYLCTEALAAVLRADDRASEPLILLLFAASLGAALSALEYCGLRWMLR